MSTPLLPIVLPGLITPKPALMDAFRAGRVRGFRAHFTGYSTAPLAPPMAGLGADLAELSIHDVGPAAERALAHIADDGLAHRAGGGDTCRQFTNSVFDFTRFGGLLRATIHGWDAYVLETVTALIPPTVPVDQRSLAIFRYDAPAGSEHIVGLEEALAGLEVADARNITHGCFHVIHVNREVEPESAHAAVAYRAQLRRDVAAVLARLGKMEYRVLPAVALDECVMALPTAAEPVLASKESR